MQFPPPISKNRLVAPANVSANHRATSALENHLPRTKQLCQTIADTVRSFRTRNLKLNGRHCEPTCAATHVASCARPNAGHAAPGGGFEHASILTDLDGDGRDELYVASDQDGELRSYRFDNGRFEKEVIYRRAVPSAYLTWNLMPVPAELVPEGEPAPMAP